MTILSEFDYFKPKSLKEALEILYDYKNCSVLAGGTDLVNDLKEERKSPSNIIDIKGLKTLSKMKCTKKSVTLGALTTFTEIIDSKDIKERLPVLFEMAKEVASVGIRNRATLVGNMCSAVPCLDSGPLLMAFDSVVHVQDYYDEREIPIEKWFKGPRKTALKKNELVTGVTFTLPSSQFGSSFLKLKRYRGEDLGQVSLAAVALPKNEYRISFGAVAGTPVRAKRIEKFLRGKELTPEVLSAAKEMVDSEISPITDIRASKEYRLHMARVMLERGLKIAKERLDGKGPAYGSVPL